MHSAGHSANQVQHGDTRADESESSRVDAGLQHAAVLLQHMYKDVDLGARV